MGAEQVVPMHRYATASPSGRFAATPSGKSATSAGIAKTMRVGT
jgi:hypothetical protein